ncbi:hypothetical protein DPQ29_25780 (plasmid) [Escherichia coli]|nr:hypothetical protein DPQ29_25780 [Escherichia coli]TFS37927.1 hypothetical protein ELT31_26060 [Escherichia coli]
MCELDILHDSLYQFCPELHLKRLNSLTLACHALLDCKTLTLTELGRNLPTKARTKHNIKRIDRLLGNRHLHKERLAVYRWHASFICSGNTMPIGHCCKVSDEAAFCLIQRPYISKTLLTRRISPRGSP